MATVTVIGVVLWGLFRVAPNPETVVVGPFIGCSSMMLTAAVAAKYSTRAP